HRRPMAPMRRALRLHPDSRRGAARRIEVEVARPRPDALTLGYFLTGATGELYMPPAAQPARADGLWRRTCFEAFVRAMPGASYLEFNFAPSTQWAAYQFGGYRASTGVVGGIAAPRIQTLTTKEGCELHVSLELDQAPGLPSDAPWRLGLCAVVEDRGGGKSYWALAHPPGPADFHHADGFACELPVPEAS
ncbi:MAG: DOMON-like domain-containing protein, partial [Pseudomonadota bacterium]